MKQAAHQLSAFRAPATRGRGTYSVNYLEGFWLNLFWDVIIELAVGLPKNPFNRLLTVRQAVVLLVGLLWFNSLQVGLFPPSRVVYADPLVRVVEPKQLPQLKPPELTTQSPLESIFVSKLRDFGTYANNYVPGQCTWYVASRLPVPQDWGNAIDWGYHAQALGYTVSPTPKAGAIAWSTTDSYLGHVAVVNPDGVTISEMNYNGPYAVDERTPNAGEFLYIYF